MNQSVLNFDAPLARATDPHTSHIAADKAKQFKGGQAASILAALVRHGPLAPCQMFTFTGLSVVQADRRLPELKRAGLAVPTGAVFNGCRVWMAV